MKLNNIIKLVLLILLSLNLYAGMGSHTPIADNNNEGIFYPSDRSTNNPTPVVFFLPGGFPSSYQNNYEPLLKFVASHGYTVIYVPNSLDEFDVFMENEKDFLDMDNIGVIGHSVGGGKVFKILLDARERLGR